MTAITFASVLLSAALMGADPDPEVDSIRKLVSAREAAWNNRDIAALVAGLAEHCDSIDSRGHEVAGREHLKKRYEEIFASTTNKDMKSEHGIDLIRVVAPGVAVVDGDWALTGIKGPDGAPAPDRRGHSTLVLLKAGDRWEIVAIRSFMRNKPADDK